MKKIVIMAMACFVLCAGCGGETAAPSYHLKSVDANAHMYIEGSYSEAIDMTDFEKLTRLHVPQSLPDLYISEPITASAYYDKDGKIINMTVGIGEGNNGYPASVSVYSSELWSSLSVSPIDYTYGSDETTEFEPATIGKTKALFFHYDDSKEQEHKLGYDVYIAEFELNGISVYVESKAMNQKEFEQFVTSLIKTANTID